MTAHPRRRGPAPGPVPDELRLGLVGCGRLAEVGYLPALARVTRFRLVAVADPDPVRRAAAAPGVDAYGSAEELLAAAAVDAVGVASPVQTHLAAARAAAAAGVTALVEKPPVRDVAEARALAELRPTPRLAADYRTSRIIV